MKRVSFILLLLAIIAMEDSAQVLYMNPQLSAEERAADLLSRMTLEEKIDQMSMTGLYDFTQTAHAYGVCDSPFNSLEIIAEQSAAAKRHARENTRLGIPPMQIAECLHGVLAYGATIFPQAIAQGSTWNPALIEEMAGAIAEEASALGIDQALSPLFDIIRDARYGRNEECYGEDPYLVGKIGCAFVKGMQGDASTTREGLPAGKIACTAKHFAGYSQPLTGINLGPASLGEREMRSTHLVPFEMAVKEANVYAVMPSYNEVDGIPAHANHWLLTDVLKKEWGFPGYTFSDYGSVGHLHNFHHVAANREEAAKMALEAGLDLEAARPEHYILLKDMVEHGLVDISLIDEAVRRILTVKIKAGVFDKPLADVRDIHNHVHTIKHVALARKVAEESAILLQNNDNLLPLDIKGIKSISVVGPNADQVQFGDYCYTRDNKYGSTVLDGIKKWAGKKVEVNYAKGCSISGLEKDCIAEAVEAARKSDVVVAVLGGTSVILSGLGWGRGPGEHEIGDPFTSGEGYDLTDINPLGVQRELLQALKDTGKPVILVLIHGRPWSIAWEKQNIPAILECWYPGECGGEVIADILFGKVNPSGRLNASVPQSAGHLPFYYNQKPSAKGINREPGTPEKAGRDYVFSSPDALFPFGHGMSYTTFEYSNMKIDSSGSDGIRVTAVVKNTGKIHGKEVVQLYVNDKVSSVTTPTKELKGFEKVYLKAGESKEVAFMLHEEDLSLWNAHMEKVTEPGIFTIMLGKSSDDIVLQQDLSIK